MTLIEEMYAELHPEHFILGIGIGETAMTPQALLAVQYGADAGYEHRSVITERALRGA